MLRSILSGIVLPAALAVALPAAAQLITWDVTQLTDNEVWDEAPSISGHNIVWSSGPFPATHIVFWSPAGSAPITTTGWNRLADVSGYRAVFSNLQDNGVHYYNGLAPAPFSVGGGVIHQGATISGVNVAWEKDDRIYISEAGQVTQVSGNGVSRRNDYGGADISGNRVTYFQCNGSDCTSPRIHFWENGINTLISSTKSFAPRISGDTVVYQYFWTYDNESGVYRWQNHGVTELATDGSRPDISGDNIIWHDNGIIYLHDGTNLLFVAASQTGNGISTPRISGWNIVWSEYDGNDYEVFLATPSAAFPPTVACNDGLDNDGDGDFDYPDDSECTGPLDLSEVPDCQDGLDNDDDGLIDYLEDVDCKTMTRSREQPDCNDGIDNDGDGAIDFPNDTNCRGPLGREKPACGLGWELLLLLPLLSRRGVSCVH